MDLFHLLRVRLRFTRPARMHFFHHAAFYAVLMDRLNTPKTMPGGVAFYCPERGRIHYAEGEAYHLGFALSPNAPLDARRLKDALAGKPNTYYAKMDGAPFGDNYRVEEVFDLVAGRAVRDRAAIFTREMLAPAAEKLAAETEIAVRFLSPLLIYRTPVHQKNFIMDSEVFHPAKFLEAAIRAVIEWWPGSKLAASIPPPPSRGTTGDDSPFAPLVELAENRLIRADVCYPKKRLLGASGVIRLRFPNGVGAFAEALLAAGAVGAGHAANMGQGRFEIIGHPFPCDWPPRPARTFLERAADPDNLARARVELAKAGPAPGVDGESRSEFMDALTHEMPRLASALKQGGLTSEPLRGVLLRKTDPETGRDKIRALAIPTLRDRFLQRAVLQEIEEAVEQLMEDSSFAYRKGLSHRTAVRGVAQARKEGYLFALDADVRAFFDEVDWDKLRARLEGFFGDDPLVEALMTWTRAPVMFEGREILREKGLPQGAVTSPILANIYLDALDEAVAEAGFRLVRYADDFVVLCKKREETARARKVVAEELRKLGLALNEDKTRETSFDEGFKFLGALFCRSMTLRIEPDGKDAVEVLESLPASAADGGAPIDAKGWLSDFLAAKLQEPADGAEDDFRWRTPLPAPAPDRRAVYLLSKTAKLTGKKQGLLIEREGDPPRMVAWRELSELVILGGHYIPSSVIQRAMHNRVPVAFHKWDGTPVGLVLPDRVRSPSATTLIQWQWCGKIENTLPVAKALIEAKIRNIHMTVRRHSGDVAVVLKELRRYEEEVSTATAPERLRGIEGQAAHAYFSQWPSWLKAPFSNYPGRVTRGAADPVNAMLNFLYTQLFRLAHTTILAAGLDPYLGVLHEGRGRYAALAADMMEPFRFLADRIVLELISHSRVESGDFLYQEKGPYPVLVGKRAMKQLIGEWDEQLGREVSDLSERKDSFRGHLFRQSLSLRKRIESVDNPFTPFRMKW